jgi:uncharacterized protein YuzE
MMKTTYDPEADAYYAGFVPEGVAIAKTTEVAPSITLDLGVHGDLVGLEVLSVRGRISGAFGKQFVELSRNTI